VFQPDLRDRAAATVVLYSIAAEAAQSDQFVVTFLILGILLFDMRFVGLYGILRGITIMDVCLLVVEDQIRLAQVAHFGPNLPQTSFTAKDRFVIDSQSHFCDIAVLS
jgi:hypothetical protein